MANEIDYDNMTDEQIDDILSQIDSGTFGSDDENQDGANTNLDENNENHSEDGDENINVSSKIAGVVSRIFVH